MPMGIPRETVEEILLGPVGDRRQLQDSPLLGDVWIAFAEDPLSRQELLITPHRGRMAADLACRIHKETGGAADVAYLEDLVAARLSFDEVLHVVVPITDWWWRLRAQPGHSADPVAIRDGIARVYALLGGPTHPTQAPDAARCPSALDRFAALAGVILWAAERARTSQDRDTDTPRVTEPALFAQILDDVETVAALVHRALPRPERRAKTPKARGTRGETESPSDKDSGWIHQVSLNRRALLAVDRSVLSVKADAARRLFSVDCSRIGWAVIDSGIAGGHSALLDDAGQTRVRHSFDFSRLRQIVSLGNLSLFSDKAGSPARDQRLRELLHDDLLHPPSEAAAVRNLKRLATNALEGLPIDWERVWPFIEIEPRSRPAVSDHGTHVAGILGGRGDPNDSSTGDGMCPDISLYDFRILAPSVGETEFAIIAALQFIRYINQRRSHATIHGANLSLSIPHDVRNYACGRTPICVECERLVDKGTVVVAAAGNFGYQRFQTRDGSYEGYAAFSITDPGNADGVITVGATHRSAPHTYGVSFFSSRGPTGDGRLKPDLVAPGERIRAPFREQWGDLDGTSMAAPHVSGAAAMLMARYPELIGHPRRIKQILCESATDLGRERSFQGHGMLDVLRALQSV